MSVRWSTWVWKHSPYSGIQLLIHLAFADYSSDEGIFWPLQQTVADKCKCSLSYVQQTVSQMTKDGYLSSNQRGLGKSNTYVLTKPYTEPANTPDSLQYDKGPTIYGGIYSSRFRSMFQHGTVEYLYILYLEPGHQPFYVGKTNSPQKRLQQHQSGAGGGATKNFAEFKMSMSILAIVDRGDPGGLEGKLIRGFQRKGVQLANVLDTLDPLGDPEQNTVAALYKKQKLTENRTIIEPSEEPSVPPPPADILPESDPQPEIERVPLDEGGEEVGAYRSRPKWQTIPAWAMKYASLFGRKYFKDRSERSSARELRDLLSTDMISEQWVETVAEWGTKPRSDGVRGTRWSYSGFLNVATDQEKYHDWEIRRANATGSGGDNPPDGTDLEAIDAKY